MTKNSHRSAQLLTALASRMSDDRVLEVVSGLQARWTNELREQVQHIVDTAQIPQTTDWCSEPFYLYQWTKPTGSRDSIVRAHEIRAFCCAALLLNARAYSVPVEALCSLVESIYTATPELLAKLPSFLDVVEDINNKEQELNAFVSVVRLLLVLESVTQDSLSQRIEEILARDQAIRSHRTGKYSSHENFAGLLRLTGEPNWQAIGRRLQEHATRLEYSEQSYMVDNTGSQIVAITNL